MISQIKKKFYPAFFALADPLNLYATPAVSFIIELIILELAHILYGFLVKKNCYVPIKSLKIAVDKCFYLNNVDTYIDIQGVLKLSL